MHISPKIVVANYVASQAALAADVFQLQPSIVPDWPKIIGKIFNGLKLEVPKLNSACTPNVYAYYYRNLTDSRWRKVYMPEIGNPYMDRIEGAKNWYNYCNPQDWALAIWILNQALKPNNGYEYRHMVMMEEWGFMRDDEGKYFPKNTHEIFSYCAQGRSEPLGRREMLRAGPFKEDTNFSQFGDTHPGHSAQFLGPISLQWKYWDKLLTTCKIPHFNLN